MKRTTFIASLLIAGSLGLTGCKDILDTKPTDRIINEYYWQNEQDALYAVNAIYRLLPAADYFYLDAVTDNALNQKTWERAYAFGNGSQTAGADFSGFWASDVWKNAYVAIQRVNYLLE